MLQAQVHLPCFCHWQPCSCPAESKQGLHAVHTHLHHVSRMSKDAASTTHRAGCNLQWPQGQGQMLTDGVVCVASVIHVPWCPS